jgi:hypothetical protein
MFKNIYFCTKEKLERKKEHLKLNQMCLNIHLTLSKSNIRKKTFYDEILLPAFKETGIFCKKKKDELGNDTLIKKNKLFVPYSYPLFRKCLDFKNEDHKESVKTRRELINFLLKYVMAADRIWMQNVQELDKKIMNLENVLDDNFNDPAPELKELELKRLVKYLKKYGSKIK